MESWQIITQGHAPQARTRVSERVKMGLYRT
jgi:hypothetical protein